MSRCTATLFATPLATPTPVGDNAHMMPTLATLSYTLAQAAQNTGPDRTMIIWAVVAFGLALLLVIVEAFLPSGGIIGALAGVCAIVGIVLFFRIDTMWGLASMTITLLALPFLIAGLIWVWPNTFVGRMLTLDAAQEATPIHSETDDSEGLSVGTLGTAITDLRPVGTCRLVGQRIDCIAQAGVIQAGTQVRIIAIEGSTIKVKPTTDA